MALSLADLRALVRAQLTTPLFANRGRLMSTCRTTESTNTTNSQPTPSALYSPRATRTLESPHPSSMMHTFVARCPTTFGPCTPHCTRSRALAILTGTLLTEPQTRSLTLSAPVPNRRQVWHRTSQRNVGAHPEDNLRGAVAGGAPQGDATAGGHDVEPWYSRPGNTLYISIPDLRWRGDRLRGATLRAQARDQILL